MLGWRDPRRIDGLVPKTVAGSLEKAFGYTTVDELLLHFPRAWSHHGAGVNVDDSEVGDTVTCVGTVISAKTGYTSTGKQMHRIMISDGSNALSATFFQAKLPARQLKTGVRAMFSGKLRIYRGQAEISHPAYVILPEPGRKQFATGSLRTLGEFGSPEELEELLSQLEYLAVYPARKGATSWALLGAVNAVLTQTPPIPEPLDAVPEGMVGFDEAVRGIHQPDDRGPEPFIERLKYNEALSLALVMALRRADVSARIAPACPEHAEGQQASMLANLPFPLTEGQQAVNSVISAELSAPVPMSRLLQGEVGSGKTIVALLAMLQVVDSGKQCALLAPTEVLAIQHARSITTTLMEAGVPATVTVLTGSMPTARRRQALLDIVSGQTDIVVGTHALIQDTVEFFDLGLVIVDEQHRFGVEQRDRLRVVGRDGITPHLLVMTATPIPRTIAMTAFGDLMVSTLRELPGGRRPISSAVVPGAKPAWVNRAWERIREEVAAGHQAFVVCPRIDGEGGVTETFETLSTQIFPELTVGLLHGRMHPEDKDEVMSDFAAGGIDVLVSTTVIEVGIDVPNATVMYIRESENFGVSQLHQLRGRVGRGGHASLCLLHTDQPEDSRSFARITAVAATSDGFRLAELDLRSRQEGDVLGTAQSGGRRRVQFLDLIDDAPVIERASRDAAALVERNRELAEQLVSDVEVEEQEFIDKT
ncbi:MULTISPECIES: ATP-dependent DNA helicase RecG [unclassified Corynebacterium]|uniref:ATP-dependent DNA helicase RecG n=1 Tax=unclassified Corynebacterium TaxID=2624378 RepID=UPI003525BBA8